MLKKWYKSKTIIFNGVAFVVAVGMILSEMKMPERALEIIGAVVAIGNVILRFQSGKLILTPKRRKKADKTPIK